VVFLEEIKLCGLQCKMCSHKQSSTPTVCLYTDLVSTWQLFSPKHLSRNKLQNNCTPLEGNHMESGSHYGVTGTLPGSLRFTRWMARFSKRMYEMAKGSFFHSCQKHDHQPLPGFGSSQDQTQSSLFAHIFWSQVCALSRTGSNKLCNTGYPVY